MKPLAASVLMILVAAGSAQAASIRWLGLHMNTIASNPGDPVQLTTTSFPSPLIDLAGVPWGPGPDNNQVLSGTATASSPTSSATTSWFINPVDDTLTLNLNHMITGTVAADNQAGSEGVFYFFALTPGTLTMTYDYGIEETDDPTAPYKVSERGQSRLRVKNNALGLGDDAFGSGEIVNRDGSRTLHANVGPADGLIALQFDFRIFDGPMPSSIPDGYLSMTFTPIPEPSSALLGLGALGLLLRRRR